MAEYKETLNLPDTAFPMKANLAQREPQRLADWQAGQVYEKSERRVPVLTNSFCMTDLPMLTAICIAAMP